MTEQRVPGVPAVVGVSLASLAACTLGFAAAGALAPELRAEFDLSRAEIGFLSSLMFIGAAIASRRGGRLTDALGAAPVLGLSLLLFSGAMALAAAAPTAALLMVGVLVTGVAYGGVNPPTNVMIAGQLQRRLGFFLSVKQTGVPLGGLLAGVVLPPIALALSWRWAFGLVVLVSVAVAASTPLVRNAAVLRDSGDRSRQEPLRRKELAALGLFGLIMSGTQWTMLTYLTLYLTEEADFSLAVAGLALGLTQGLGAVGRLVWGWLSDAPGRRVTILVLIAATGIACLGVLASNPGSPIVWPLLAVAGFSIVGWNGAYHALLAERAGPGRVGRASGDALVFVFSGPVILPPLLGLLVDSVGSWQPLWAVNAAIVAVAGVGLWAGLRGPAEAPAATAARTP